MYSASTPHHCALHAYYPVEAIEHMAIAVRVEEAVMGRGQMIQKQ